jgi:hypothetical protein
MFGRFAVHLALSIALLPATAAAQKRFLIDARGTVNLDELARQPESHQKPSGPRREVFDPEREIHGKNHVNAAIGLPRATTPLPTTANVTPVYTGFQALLDNFTTIPPDTNGAVAPQYIVTMLNTQMLIQSRDGAWRNNYPINLGGRFGFWSAVTISNDVFDPNIAYDAANDRWIASAVVDSQKSSSALVVACRKQAIPVATGICSRLALVRPLTGAITRCWGSTETGWWYP